MLHDYGHCILQDSVVRCPTMRQALLLLIIVFLTPLIGCRKKGCTDPESTTYNSKAKKNDGSCYYTVPYTLEVPELLGDYLPAPSLSSENALTQEGVSLGRKLYYDPILDGIASRSCSSCHFQVESFTSNVNSQPPLNLAWNTNFLWNGKVQGSVEDIMLFEVEDFFATDVSRLNGDENYKQLFKEAFGVDNITSKEIAFALAQFIRTIISGNSKFDRFLLNQEALTPSEMAGYNVFMDEEGGDCFHCHGSAVNPLWTDNQFHNNGLDATFTELGLGQTTGNPADNGKFKTPSLRNLIFTAPYMHDGRFASLDEVLLHYSIGLQNSSTIDPLMKNVSQGGAQLTPQELVDLKAFLLTLTDYSILENESLGSP